MAQGLRALNLCYYTMLLCCHTSLALPHLFSHSVLIVSGLAIEKAPFVPAHGFRDEMRRSAGRAGFDISNIDARKAATPRSEMNVASLQHITEFTREGVLPFFLCETTIFCALRTSFIESAHTIIGVGTLYYLHETTIFRFHWAANRRFLCWHTLLSVSAPTIRPAISLYRDPTQDLHPGVVPQQAKRHDATSEKGSRGGGVI